jgi:hypothetical protein
MTTALVRPNQTKTPEQPASQTGRIEQVLIGGDLSKLTTPEREVYYLKTCETLSLNPLTRPFDYITLNGKLVLYANKGCAEQLRSVRKISITVTAREMIGEVFVVTANAKGQDGREDSATGAVSAAGLKGDALANAMMKAETKAKRRVTLSICGLNMLDETEVETIPEAKGSGMPIIRPDDGGSGFTPEGYRIPFGKWNRYSINWVLENEGPDELAKYIARCEDPEQVAKLVKGRAHVAAQVAEFIEIASDALAAYEMELAKEMGSRG